MIVVRICLGLGNQLFQYAYARALAEKGKDVYIDSGNFFDSNFGEQEWYTKRTYKLDCYNITLEQAKDHVLRDVELRENIETKSMRYIKEMRNGYVSELEEIDDCYIEGWFQSEKYFEQIRNILLEELTPRYKADASLFYEKLVSESNSVAMHIRRGDFVKDGMALNKYYYLQAIEKMNEEVENPRYFVFSDDVEWVKRNIGNNKDFVYVNEDRQMDEINELHIMSMCKSFIISNSTFSWWGAWLSQNQKKVVIAPKIWYPNQKGIVPEKWRII